MSVWKVGTGLGRFLGLWVYFEGAVDIVVRRWGGWEEVDGGMFESRLGFCVALTVLFMHVVADGATAVAVFGGCPTPQLRPCSALKLRTSHILALSSNTGLNGLRRCVLDLEEALTARHPHEARVPKGLTPPP